MSHFMRVKLKLKDLGIFKEACETIGIEFSEDQKVCHSAWAGETTCDGVFLDNKGGEGGVIKDTKTDDYNIVWDSYNNSLANVVGKDCSKLMREYTTIAVKQQIGQVGMLTNEELQEDGSVVLTGVFV